MKFYVVYHIKGNFSPSDIILEIPDGDMDHHRSIRPGYQGRHGQAQWKWTERNIGVVKKEIAAGSPALSYKPMDHIILYSVRQII